MMLWVVLGCVGLSLVAQGLFGMCRFVDRLLGVFQVVWAVVERLTSLDGIRLFRFGKLFVLVFSFIGRSRLL